MAENNLTLYLQIIDGVIDKFGTAAGFANFMAQFAGSVSADQARPVALAYLSEVIQVLRRLHDHVSKMPIGELQDEYEEEQTRGILLHRRIEARQSPEGIAQALKGARKQSEQLHAELVRILDRMEGGQHHG